MTIKDAILFIKFGKYGFALNANIENEEIIAIKMAIAALEKQEPKQPIKNTTSYICPVCGKSLQKSYPCQCGQIIDWTDN